MKFIYQYRTPDNKQHEAVISAPTKDAAYAALKAQGVKPGRMYEAPGVFNKLFGKGKRWIAIVVLGALCLVLCLVVRSMKEESAYLGSVDFITSTARRQLVGDIAVIEKGIKEGWGDVFDQEGERYLASFAIPSVGTPYARSALSDAEVLASLGREVLVNEDDGIEARQIKSMVVGMKDELRRYLAAGGKVEVYRKRLVERQSEEIAIHHRVKNEVENARKSMKENEFVAYWEKRNAELRNLGLRLVPMPE